MFKLGFVSAILADLSFEEVVDFASVNGYACVEMLCWPKGKAERRYAGVTHIDVNELDEQKIKSIKKNSLERCILKYRRWSINPILLILIRKKGNITLSTSRKSLRQQQNWD